MPDAALRETIFARIRSEWHGSIDPLLMIMRQERLLQSNPLLERSIRNRFPYLDPLNHVQVELLKEHRAQAPTTVLRGIHFTINGISAALGIAGRPLSTVIPGRAPARTRNLEYSPMCNCTSGVHAKTRVPE